MGPQVSAIILAAGSSRRMGQLKQLLPLGGKPVLRHSLDTIVSSGITDIVVVLGPQAGELVKTIEGLESRRVIPPEPPLSKGGSGHFVIKIAFNNDPDSDMAESVRVGLREVAPASSGVLVCLADQPLVMGETIDRLLRLHSEDPSKILVPRYEQKKGHPPLFSRLAIEEIFASPTLREVINRDGDRIRYVDVSDEGVVLDMDTMDDYVKLVRRMESK